MDPKQQQNPQNPTNLPNKNIPNPKPKQTDENRPAQPQPQKPQMQPVEQTKQQNQPISDNTPTHKPNTLKTKKTQQKQDNIPLDSSRIPHWDQTQNLIGKLQESFNQKVITLYVTKFSKLTNQEVEELHNHLYKIGKVDNLFLIIHGPGGSGKAAYRIVKLIREFTKNLTIVAPGKAASAMTMLSLGGDRILVGPLSYFTPIDSSISNHPLAPLDSHKRPVSVEINQVQKFLELVDNEKYSNEDDFRKTPHHTLADKVHPLFLGTIQRSLSLSKLLVKGIAETHIDNQEVIKKLMNKLNDEYPIHSYPILKEDLVNMGLENIEDLTDEQNMLCQELFSFFDSISSSPPSVKDNIRTSLKRYVFIESVGLRSYVLAQRKEKYMKNKWVTTSSFVEYNRSAVVKNKKGYREVVPLNTKQFRKWIKGEEIQL